MNLDTDEALKIHIEGLQSTLGKRNVRIKELEAKLAEPIDLDEKMHKMLKKAYKDGWQDCAKELASATQQAAANLGRIRKEALDVYLKAELHIPNSTPSELEEYKGTAYCVKCKEVIEFEGTLKVSDSGRRMAQGNCSRCGTKVNRILGKAV